GLEVRLGGDFSARERVALNDRPGDGLPGVFVADHADDRPAWGYDLIEVRANEDHFPGALAAPEQGRPNLVARPGPGPKLRGFDRRAVDRESDEALPAHAREREAAVGVGDGGRNDPADVATDVHPLQARQVGAHRAISLLPISQLGDKARQVVTFHRPEQTAD